MTTTIGAIAPVITAAGAALQPDVLDKLIQVRIQRAANLMGRATLRFGDSGFELSARDTFSLGTEIVISQPDAGTLFTGAVTGVDLEQLTGSLPELVIIADDNAYKLTRGTHVDTYLQGTYTQALSTLAGRTGIQISYKPSGLTMDYLLQAGSDLDFLNAVADRLGYAWYVDETGMLHVEPLSAGTPVATLTLGANLQEFSVRASGLRPTAVSVYGWNSDQQTDVTDSSTQTSGETPTFLSKYTAGAPASQLTSATTAVTQPRPLTAAEAKVLADARYDDWSSAAIVARGSASVNSAIKPGVTVTVKDAGPASGNYLVTEVEHTYDKSGFSTKFVSGSRHPARLVDTLGREAADPGFTMFGLVVGVVTDNNDPDSAGRVKVRYTGVSGQVESPWARVVTLGAGPSRGAVFNPEINDEVLVGFEHGDTRRPVVIGGLFSTQNTLPTGSAYVAEGQVNYRRIASRKNHIVEFADGAQPAQQHVLLQLGTAAHKLRLGADRFDIEVEQGKGLTIKAGSAKFDISSAGDVTIEGNNVTIKANAAVTVQGQTQATVKSEVQTVVQSSAEVQVKANATTSVEATGPLTLKGAVVAIN
jgi:phage protein D/phage baseplate assembly protein gpV